MTYPPFPQQQPGFPQQPGYPPHKPSGATAITAGVLAVLGGLFHLLAVILLVVHIAQHRLVPVMFVPLVLNLVLAGLLLPGGILLFVRKPAGRMMTIIGSGMALAFFLLSFTLGAIGISAVSLGVGIAGRSLTLIVAFAPAIATLVLAIVKPTAVWVGSAGPQPPMMMPGPGQYPPQQHYWGGPPTS